MLHPKQIAFLLCGLCALAAVSARPDSAGKVPLPGPGLSYGGIPYGSMSGNVAQYFRQVSSSGRRSNQLTSDVDFAPIEQWLR